MTLSEIILFNPILLAALTAWFIAQVLKVLIEFILLKRWNWALLFQAGGMPSSHSAMVSAMALSIGLYMGFDLPVFAVASILAMIVIYDATGIRREAGRQAVLINTIIEEIAKGKLSQHKRLKEVLGHTPGEAILGTLLGLGISLIFWIIVP
ncbi:MAG: divergent PAP2 family protein [Anaerolineales bacterium]|nr:divergent PAP2 family protein [Anaerolineales bacterium]